MGAPTVMISHLLRPSMSGNSVIFSPVAGARERVLLLGPPGVLFHRIVNSARSLQESEYVVFNRSLTNELGASGTDTAVLAEARHWYWSRKRDRGFLLTSFPVTLGQALVLDEWMDAREESLSRCLWLHQSHAAAALEAARCHVCPEDGFIGYADPESFDGVPFCDTCGTQMRSCADEALAAVDRWHQTMGRTVEEVARHYADLGLLQRVDAADLEVSPRAVC